MGHLRPVAQAAATYLNDALTSRDGQLNFRAFLQAEIASEGNPLSHAVDLFSQVRGECERLRRIVTDRPALLAAEVTELRQQSTDMLSDLLCQHLSGRVVPRLVHQLGQGCEEGPGCAREHVHHLDMALQRHLSLQCELSAKLEEVGNELFDLQAHSRLHGENTLALQMRELDVNNSLLTQENSRAQARCMVQEKAI